MPHIVNRNMLALCSGAPSVLLIVLRVFEEDNRVHFSHCLCKDLELFLGGSARDSAHKDLRPMRRL